MCVKSITYARSSITPINVFYNLMNFCISLLKALNIYKGIYNASLALMNFFNKKKLVRFYSQFIKKGCLVFDIGANFGSRTEIFLKLGARVVAVEPQEACIRDLERKYGNNKEVTLIKKAISDKFGEEELMISDSHTLSSMSKEWIDSIKSSEMFFVSTEAFSWQRSAMVNVATLDQLIQEYGKPSFCKIDVEGYEYKVLKGLSEPINFISFEFTPTREFIIYAIDAVKHLASLGEVKFNYIKGESLVFALKEWVGLGEIINILSKYPRKLSISGDIYATFIF